MTTEPTYSFGEVALYQGDLSVLDSVLRDGSVDLFFTDPPYPKEFLPLYERLAVLAQAKLKPGGLCLAYAFQFYVPRIMEMMSKHLDFYWMFALATPGVQGSFVNWYGRTIKFGWKPVLAYIKRPARVAAIPLPHAVFDLETSPNPEKDSHDWQQNVEPIERWVEKLTAPGSLVVDPFLGGGTTAVAAYRLGRRFVGTDIDPAAVDASADRLESMRLVKEDVW